MTSNRVLRMAALVTTMLVVSAAEITAQHRVVLRGQRFQPAHVVATVGDSGMRGELIVRERADRAAPPTTPRRSK